MRQEAGFTLIELLMVLVLMGIFSGFAVFYLKDLQNPAESAANEIVSFFKVVRAKALASTLAYSIAPSSAGGLITTYASTCSDSGQSADSTITMNLPNGAYLPEIDWVICYDPRGRSNSSQEILVRDGSSTKIVQVVLGGAVRAI